MSSQAEPGIRITSVQQADRMIALAEYAAGAPEKDQSPMLRDMIRELRAGAQALRETPAQGWQDISTAPKDGTLVLVVYVEGGMAVRRQVKRHFGMVWADVVGNQTPTPTHWMPLPLPPSGDPR